MESKKEWAKKMLELDLKAQSGAIWTEEKSNTNAERKSKPYVIDDQDPHLLVADSVFYGGRKKQTDEPSLLK